MQRQGTLARKRIAIEHVKHAMQAAEIARQVCQEVPDDLLGELQAASPRFGAHLRRLFRIAQRLDLVDKTPSEPGSEVLAKRKLRRRRIARSEHCSFALARGVNGEKERLLGGGVEALDIVSNDEIRIARCAA